MAVIAQPLSAGSNSRRVEITPFMAYNIVQGTWQSSENTSAVFGATTQNSSAALGDGLSWTIELSSGTWTLNAMLYKAVGGGIITPSLNGTALTTTFDTYGSSSTFNNVFQATGVVVPNSGLQTFSMVVTGRNASNTTAYSMRCHQFIWVRTA